MQDVDRVANVQVLPEPGWLRGVRVEGEPFRLVVRADARHGIARELRRRRHVGQHTAVRLPELQLAVRPSLDLIALFVNRAVMPATQQRQIGQRRGPALRPVTEVMALAEPHAAARKPTAAVPVLERPP
jgi:hypothetical protein